MAAPLLAEAYSQARLDLDSLDKDIRRAQQKLKKAAESMERTLRLKVTIDDTGARNRVAGFEKYVKTVKARVEADAISLAVDPDVDTSQAAQVGRQAAQAVEAGFGTGKLQVTAEVDTATLAAKGAAARKSAEAGLDSLSAKARPGALPSLDRTAEVEVKVTGERKLFSTFAKILVQKIAVGRDIDINVDVDRRGGLKRGVATAGRLASTIASGIGSGLSTAASALSTVGEIGSAVGKQVQGAFSGATDQLASFAQTAGKAAGAVSSAAGPIGSAVAGIASSLALPALVTVVVGAVAALAGPVIAAVGGLIGGAIAFLGASAVAGLAAAGLPLAAVLLGPAKDELKKLLEPLKAQLLDSFAPTTDLIVNRIAPAFAGVAAALIPQVAKVSEGFITPIADSLFNLFASPALADAITRLSIPMAEGLASIIDTFAKYVPQFTDIALTIGPPITDAVNSILEVLFTLGSVFADDIAGGFRVISDLFDNIRPTLAGLGPILEPILGLLAALIQAFVDAGAGVEAKMGPIGDVIDEIAAAVPKAVPGLIALGQLFVQLLGYLPRIVASLGVFAALVTGTFAGITGAAYVLVNGLTVVFKFFGFFIDQTLNLWARAAGGLAGLADALSFDGVAESLRGQSAEIDGLREGVRELGNDGFALGDRLYGAANGFGEMTDTALGLGGALDPVKDKAKESAAAVRELDAELRTGKIGFAEYASAVGTVDQAGIAFAGVIDGLVKRAGEGAFAISSFADDVKQELSTAADFVETITVKDPVGQFREDRDRQREMQNLDRQATRDAEQIGRNAEDYQRAIADAAELRAEAPKAYTFGARNFNAALFADAAERQKEYDERVQDAQRNIEDRARALDDARRQAEDSRIAVEDARYDALFGEPKDIEVQVIDIRAALEKAGRDIADTTSKTLTLIQIRNMGLEFDPLADFLEGLDPEQFRQAIEQLGGVQSEAFRQAAIERNRAVDEGNTSFAQSLAASRNLIEEESLRIDRLIDLRNVGADSLIAELSKIESAAEFNAVFESAENGVGGLAGAEAELDRLTQEELPALLAKADAAGYAVTKETDKAFLQGAARALEESRAGAAGATGAAAAAATGVANRLFGGSSGAGGGGADDPIEQARKAGEDTATAFAEGFDTAFASDQVQNLSTLVDDLFTNANYESFAVAGQDSAEKFYDGMESAFRNDTNQAFALGAFGSLLLSIRLQQGEYEAVGAQLGGAVIAGMLVGFNVQSVSLNGALQLLAGSIAVEAVVETWRSSGSTLGQAVLDGISAGVEAQRQFLSGRLGAVRVGIVLQTNAFTLAGAALGVGLIVGMVAALQQRTALVVLAVAAIALATLGTANRWSDAGTALAQVFLTALADRIVRAATDVSLAVQALVSQLNLIVLVNAGLDIGTAIVAGLIQGILNGREGVENAARILARAAADASAKELQVNSPSRVFMRLGESTGEGFGLGIDDSAALAIDSAAKVASAVLAASTVALQQGTPGGLRAGLALGAGLPEQVSSAATAAQTTFNQQTGTVDNSASETNVWNIYGSDPRETAAEIAQRQRARRYLNGGKR